MSEVVVVGAGPAGVAAAVAAAQAGAQVTLIEEQNRPGGQYFKQPGAACDPQHFPPSLAANIRQGRELLAGLHLPNIHLRCGTLVWDVTPERTLRLYTLPGAPGESDNVQPSTSNLQRSTFNVKPFSEALQAKRLIIAAGAYERVMPFPGWTLPGVMTVGAAQLLLKGQGLLAGRRLLLAGTGPLLQLAGLQLLEAGAEVAAIVELQARRQFLSGAASFWGQWDKVSQALSHRQQLSRAGVPLKYAHAVVRAFGQQEVSGAVVAKVDGKGRPLAGTEESLAVDTICLNFGFIPATELTRLAGCRQRFDPHFGCLATETNDQMETSQAGIFAVGEVRGIGGVDVALLEGAIAGAAAAGQLGYRADETSSERENQARAAKWRQARKLVAALGTMFPLKPGLCSLAQGEVVVCRCEEVTAGAIRTAVRAGATQLNDLKAWTRVGMGRCQGRVCGSIAAQIVAQEANIPVAAVGDFTARPPLKPVPLGVIAGPAPESEALEWEDHVTQYGFIRNADER
jgi:D-hydroxyproline dehydrogenase subunit alpha